MAFWKRWFGNGSSATAAMPRAAVQGAGGGVLINTSHELEEVIRNGALSASGASVTPDSAMRVAAVYACVRLRAGVVANIPVHIKKRIDDRTRNDARDHPAWSIFRRRPNPWQTPSQFKRMMQAHLLLRGNAYAMITRSSGRVTALIPLNPDQVECTQNGDLSLSYEVRRSGGSRIRLNQKEVFHLVGLTLNGITGVSVIAYSREAIGLSMAMEKHGSQVFRNGARVSSVLKHPGKLGSEGLQFLKESLDQYREGGESEGKALILEEGMDVQPLAMTAEDAQWIESRKFSRTDIAMFFGVPPHMIGDTEKSTSWGSGIDSQTQGFVTFSAEDDLTTWEETINRDLIPEADIYARFNRAALVRADIKTRWATYQIGRQLKVLSANDVRVLEDMNPIDGGDVYENPNIDKTGDGDEPPQPA